MGRQGRLREGGAGRGETVGRLGLGVGGWGPRLAPGTPGGKPSLLRDETSSGSSKARARTVVREDGSETRCKAYRLILYPSSLPPRNSGTQSAPGKDQAGLICASKGVEAAAADSAVRLHPDDGTRVS